MATFSIRLSELMIEKEISAQNLAAVLGVHKATVHNWKRGTQIFLSKAIKVAKFFECSLDYLMGRTEFDTPFIHKDCPPFYLHFMKVLAECGVTTYRIRTDTHIDGAYFNNWKNGTDPLMPTLITIADYLKVSLDHLVGRDN
ncbi:MAG: helix-turn-helix domain-containing protein [Firmicutes bacterium]|nr:helix-turn-helix domain-containing protein [Bacillota bacterium]